MKMSFWRLAPVMTWVLTFATAQARDFRVNQIPNGDVFRCQNCHVSANGGGSRNAFGNAVFSITGGSAREFWTATLANRDSDGDGYSNGTELGDPDGDGFADDGALVTNPGSSASRPQRSLKAVLQSKPAYSTLVQALERAGLLDVLAGPGPFTLFAPTDTAFATLGAPLAGAWLANTNRLPALLLYHGVPGSLRAANLVAGELTTLEGAKVTITKNGNVTLVNGTTITLADQLATNGVLHELGGVLSPPAPAAINLSIHPDPQGLRLEWTGGRGPFTLQRRARLDTGDWVNLQTVDGRSVTTPVEAGSSGFFRVADRVHLGASIRSAFVLPDTGATGQGEATATLDGNRLEYRIVYSELSSPITAAHVRGPAGLAETAGVLLGLIPGVADPGFFEGSIPQGTDSRIENGLPDVTVRALLEGRTYINLQTDEFPEGALRGQWLALP